MEQRPLWGKQEQPKLSIPEKRLNIEEQKQERIIRMAVLNAAIAYSKLNEKKLYSKHDVLVTAKEFEQFILKRKENVEENNG